ncbi:MAG: hypothetical protein AB7G23_02345 [Vicinamibacterales bacterium]
MIRLLILCLTLFGASSQAMAQVPAVAPTSAPARAANEVRLDVHLDGDETSLVPATFTVVENGVVQRIDYVERVVRGDDPAQASGAGPRRVVVFVDAGNLRQADSRWDDVVALLDDLIADDDRVAVVSRETSDPPLFGAAADALARVALLRSVAAQGPDADRALQQRLTRCLAGDARDGTAAFLVSGLVRRHREATTFDRLDTLVADLHPLADDRTAVLIVTDGWQLAGAGEASDVDLADRAGRPGGRGRDDDRLSRGDGPARGALAPPARLSADCRAERARLLALDNISRVRSLAEEGNRSAITFYPVLLDAVASTAGPAEGPGPDSGDDRAATEASRRDSARALAAESDGVAMLDARDLPEMRRRVAADARAYYFLSYRSSNTRLDGRTRAITLRSETPGVSLRARRGYRGRTVEDLLAEAAGIRGGGVPAESGAFRIRANAWAAAPGVDGPDGVFWVTGELDYATRRELAWTAGGTADLVVIASDGRVVARAEAPLGSSGVLTLRVPEVGGLEPGEYAVQLAVRPDAAPADVLADTARVVLPATPSSIGEAVIWRRGPSSGPDFVQTATARFRRNERIRVELPTTRLGTASARMLDRRGSAMQVPVVVSSRPDESGAAYTWLGAEAALAPLAAGDYAIEVTVDGVAHVTPFAVVP